jgi:multidrug efflux system membrane fusion protein
VVKKGDLLFEIDPRPYQAQLDQAESQVRLAEASLKLARATFERDRKLAQATPGSVSPQQLEQDRAALEEAEARLKAAQAGAEVHKLNLDFTKITAPIDGRAGRYLQTPGNLVNQDQTVLTTLVSLDPMYVLFDMDERSLLRHSRLAREDRGKPPGEGRLPALVGLADEEGFPHQGTVNFVDNRVDPVTGTIRVRVVLANAGPGRVLRPGLFARVRLPLGPPHKALLVPDAAVGTDEGQKFLYVVNDKDQVVSRRVTVGALHDGLRVVEEGLRPGERVIIGRVNKVRPGMTVKPRQEPLPQRPEAPR